MLLKSLAVAGLALCLTCAAVGINSVIAANSFTGSAALPFPFLRNFPHAVPPFPRSGRTIFARRTITIRTPRGYESFTLFQDFKPVEKEAEPVEWVDVTDPNEVRKIINR